MKNHNRMSWRRGGRRISFSNLFKGFGKSRLTKILNVCLLIIPLLALAVLTMAPGTGAQLGTVTRESIVSALGGNPSSVVVDSKGNIRVGTNQTSFTHATNAIVIGSIWGATYPAATGNGIIIGGNGGGVGIRSIAIGYGSAAGTQDTYDQAGSIAIGDQTDAFGPNSVVIGQGVAGILGAYDLVISSQGQLSENFWTNVIVIGGDSNVGVGTRDNQTMIGTAITVETLLYGTLRGNAAGLTNSCRYAIFPQTACPFSAGTHHFIGFGGLDGTTEANVSSPIGELPVTVSNTVVRFSNLVATTNAHIILVTNGARSSYSNSVDGAGAGTTVTISGAFTIPAGVPASWEVLGNNASAYAGNVSIRATVYEKMRQ